jgi:hypothetical protein
MRYLGRYNCRQRDRKNYCVKIQIEKKYRVGDHVEEGTLVAQDTDDSNRILTALGTSS